MNLDPIDDNTILLCDDLPWNDIRMMLGFRKENSVSFFQKS